MTVQSKSMCLHACTVSLLCINACSYWRPERVNAVFSSFFLVWYFVCCMSNTVWGCSLCCSSSFCTSQDPPSPFVHDFLGHSVMKANNCLWHKSANNRSNSNMHACMIVAHICILGTTNQQQQQHACMRACSTNLHSGTAKQQQQQQHACTHACGTNLHFWHNETTTAATTYMHGIIGVVTPWLRWHFHIIHNLQTDIGKIGT